MMNLKVKTTEQLEAIQEELDIILAIDEEEPGNYMSDDEFLAIENLNNSVCNELFDRRNAELKERAKTERPSFRAGYYAGRGYYDAKPKRRVKEFHFKVTEYVARNQDDLLWDAAEADLEKKWKTKTEPHPSVEEVWMIDDPYDYL